MPRTIEIYAQPARLAGSRFKEADEDTPEADMSADGFVLDETAPIPDTPDGFVYYLTSGGGEFQSVEAAKRWADARPWGPVRWDERR